FKGKGGTCRNRTTAPWPRDQPPSPQAPPSCRRGNGRRRDKPAGPKEGAPVELLNLFWLFLILSSLQPMLRQRMIENRRIAVIRALERQRGSRVITLIHRQESVSFLGIPISRYIDINDSEQVLRAIKLTPEDMPLDLILRSEERRGG